MLGIKGSTFPARKALDQSRTLGPERLHEFVLLLAGADLDLRGARAWPSDLVVEVLVARLAARTPKARAGAGRPPSLRQARRVRSARRRGREPGRGRGRRATRSTRSNSAASIGSTARTSSGVTMVV